jgi:orotidine-5'-phosphate decarboxylase
MQTTNSQNPLQQECLKNLQKILDLAMHTAEAASTEGNHKVVLQAVREVTRIITLMTKLSQNTDQQVKPKSRSASAQAQIPALAPRNSKAGAPASAEEMQLIQEIFSDLLQPGVIQPLAGDPKRSGLDVGTKLDHNGKKGA